MFPHEYNPNWAVQCPAINIQVIPHSEQRYDTCGDWWWNEEGTLQIRVSKMGNAHYEFLVGLHEMVEAYCCASKGISEKTVTDFDLEFEKMRSEYPKIVADKEPGNDDESPYFHEHAMASRLERWLGDSIGVDWKTYDETVNQL